MNWKKTGIFINIPLKGATNNEVSVNKYSISEIRVVSVNSSNKWAVQIVVSPGTVFLLNTGPLTTKEEALRVKYELELLTGDEIAIPEMYIIDPIATQDSIMFSLDIIDVYKVGSISSVDIYNGVQLVESLVDFDTTKFENLLSDTTYTLKATYSYTIDDATETIDITKDIKTLAKVAPVVSIPTITSDTESIDFNINVVDIDSTFIEVTDIELYKEGVLVEALDDLELNTFDNLLSDTEYSVKVTYSYDLNNGVGLQSGSVSKDIKTLAKTAPVAVITDVVPTATTIEFDYTITDPTNSLVDYSLQIVDPDNVVTTLPSNDLRIFEELASDTEYTIRVFMTYDLNDGTGEQLTLVAFDTKTLAE